MPLNNATAAFIGASVTLFLVIVFMILMVILVRQCLAFLAKRNAIRAQTEQQQQARRQFERQRRGSITEPVPATFDWHHSIRIAGTPPPSYTEAKGLPSFEDASAAGKKKRARRERSREQEETDSSEVIVTRNRCVSEGDNNSEDSHLQADNAHQRRHTSPVPTTAAQAGMELQNGGLPSTVELENERNSEMMTTELTTVQVAVDIESTSTEHSGEFEILSGDENTVEVNRSAHVAQSADM
jgi:type II secretory pathway pseudopilin PulG